MDLEHFISMSLILNFMFGLNLIGPNPTHFQVQKNHKALCPNFIQENGLACKVQSITHFKTHSFHSTEPHVPSQLEPPCSLSIYLHVFLPILLYNKTQGCAC
eukprot:TRINITY_DN277_c1_g1_i4.p1 TRINITY_DN277_c1_g1~~TRINITY_DN277_c1_g1_i4.p1  ORF type:complete len:102 (+),score=8.92 TRINITY_DN277_c1_g1_i4:363-668(+)